MKKMICSHADICAKKPIWNRPIIQNDKTIGHTPVKFGHCIPHRHNEHCNHGGDICPKCVKK